jgi:PAS domain S-box-containing protein
VRHSTRAPPCDIFRAMRVASELQDTAYRALIEAAPDGVLVVGEDGIILLANPELARLTGWSPEELLGQPVERLVPAAARARHVEHRGTFVANPHSRPMGANLSLVAVRKDGVELPVEIMLAALDHGGKRATIAFVRDATERRRRQAALEEANAASNAAVRELEAFSYSVAHDLRAPLRAIDGFAQALLEDNAEQLDADGKDHLARVRAAAQRMGHLIDDLLALSRLSRTELRRERVDLARLARDAEARLRQANPDRRVEVDIAGPLPASADAQMMSVVFDNLLGNAWKFTRPRAIAHVHVGRAAGGPFFVKDDGVGFDMQFASTLFTPFKRLHGAREFEGTGIGLATVARVVQRHGGRIWAEAAPDAGAAFYFTLGPEETP